MRRFGVAACFAVNVGLAIGLSIGAGVLPGRVGAQEPADRSVSYADVSCAAARMCMVVGRESFVRNGPGRPVAARWDGAVWTSTPVPQPPHSGDASLNGVSCSAPDACMAVGIYSTQARPGELLPYAASWDGTAWRVVEVRRSGLRILNRVSCVSARACVAVGEVLRGGYPRVSAAVWDGRAWRARAPRRPAGETYSGLNDVACTSARSCVAVGVYLRGQSNRFRTLVEVWDGRTWTLRSSPSPRAGSDGSALRGVACYSARSCMAVGYRYAPPGGALVERFDGAAWELSHAPRPAASGGVSLLGVKCPARRRCVSVGLWADRGGRQYAHALAQTWDGRRWQIETVPGPAGAISTLLARVSCSAPDMCMALGSYSTADELAGDGAEETGGPLVLVWNGAAWSIAASP